MLNYDGDWMIEMVKLYFQILVYSMHQNQKLDQIEIQSKINIEMVLYVYSFDRINTFLSNDVQSRFALFSAIRICLLSGTDIES